MLDRFERFSYALLEISRHWHKLTSDEMEKYDLKGPHAVYLLTIYRYPEGLTAQQLCAMCNKDKADVSRMMSIMEKKGLIIKESVNKNRYGGVFKLTPDGIHAAERVRIRATTAVELAGRDLTDETRAIFYGAMESIAANLGKLSKDGIPD